MSWRTCRTTTSHPRWGVDPKQLARPDHEGSGCCVQLSWPRKESSMSNPRDVLVRLGELGKHQDPDTLYRAAVDRARRLRRRRHLLEAAVPVAVVVALLLVWVTRPSSGERVHTSPSPSSSTGTVSANDLSPAISQPTAIAVSDGHVWVTGYAPGN